jgi:hypothetical protein
VVHCHQQHLLAPASRPSRVASPAAASSSPTSAGRVTSPYTSTDRWFHGHLHISQYSRRVMGQRANLVPRHPDRRTPRSSPTHACPGPAARFRGPPLRTRESTGHRGAPARPPARRRRSAVRPKRFALLRELATGKRPVPHRPRRLEAGRDHRRSRCVILPSLYRDRYGNETKVPELMGQTLEGMACGIPAICTNVASMPEAVVNGSLLRRPSGRPRGPARRPGHSLHRPRARRGHGRRRAGPHARALPVVQRGAALPRGLPLLTTHPPPRHPAAAGRSRRPLSPAAC